jgi:intracellular septation protein
VSTIETVERAAVAEASNPQISGGERLGDPPLDRQVEDGRLDGDRREIALKTSPMKNLFHAGKFLLLDMASTLFFLALYLSTDSISLSVAFGVALGIAQIGWQFARKTPIETMEWLSLFLVVGSGAATLITNDPRFVLFKPSLIYLIVAVVMLKPGWMTRYLPPVAMEIVPDVASIFGFVWSGLMFFSAALNAIVALNFSVVAWASIMSIYAIGSKFGLFLTQYATMRYIGVRRRRAQMKPALPDDHPHALPR